MTWSQRWLDCLFLHFPAPVAAIAPFVPPRLEVETFGGSAWISYVLFRLKVRPAWMPFVPGLSSLLELNVRTYVRHRGQSGICFLRMFADNRLAISAARLLTPLPYEQARMTYDSNSANCQLFADAGRRLSLHFTPPSSFAELRSGTLDAWLLERYRLFIGSTDAAVVAADVEHPPWRATELEPKVAENTLCTDLGISLESQPAIAHYSPGVRARFGAFHTVAAASRHVGQSTALSHRDVTQARAGGRCGGR